MTGPSADTDGPGTANGGGTPAKCRIWPHVLMRSLIPLPAGGLAGLASGVLVYHAGHRYLAGTSPVTIGLLTTAAALAAFVTGIIIAVRSIHRRPAKCPACGGPAFVRQRTGSCSAYSYYCCEKCAHETDSPTEPPAFVVGLGFLAAGMAAGILIAVNGTLGRYNVPGGIAFGGAFVISGLWCMGLLSETIWRAKPPPAGEEANNAARNRILIAPGTVPAPAAFSLPRALAVQAAAFAAMMGGMYLAGDSPRPVIYGFFFNYLYRLPTIALLDKLLCGGNPVYARLAGRLIRLPHPEQSSHPIIVETSRSVYTGSLLAYVFLMAVLFVLCLMEVNGSVSGGMATVHRDLLWGAGIGSIWWAQDLYERRICIDPGKGIGENLGYNSNETGIAAITVLIPGVVSSVRGNPWYCLIGLILLRDLVALREDYQWPRSR